MSNPAGYVVVDIWRAKPGKSNDVERLLMVADERFQSIDGIVSVDYARLDDQPDMYLVIFRYATKAAREAFQQTETLRATMSDLRQVWDLESPIYRGETFN